MKEEFYFLNPKLAVAHATAVQDAAERALKELEDRRAQRQRDIEVAKSQVDKERLRLEQQKDAALGTVRRLALENAKKEL